MPLWRDAQGANGRSGADHARPCREGTSAAPRSRAALWQRPPRPGDAPTGKSPRGLGQPRKPTSRTLASCPGCLGQAGKPRTARRCSFLSLNTISDRGSPVRSSDAEGWTRDFQSEYLLRDRRTISGSLPTAGPARLSSTAPPDNTLAVIASHCGVHLRLSRGPGITATEDDRVQSQFDLGALSGPEITDIDLAQLRGRRPTLVPVVPSGWVGP